MGTQGKAKINIIDDINMMMSGWDEHYPDGTVIRYFDSNGAEAYYSDYTDSIEEYLDFLHTFVENHPGISVSNDTTLSCTVAGSDLAFDTPHFKKFWQENFGADEDRSNVEHHYMYDSFEILLGKLTDIQKSGEKCLNSRLRVMSTEDVLTLSKELSDRELSDALVIMGYSSPLYDEIVTRTTKTVEVFDQQLANLNKPDKSRISSNMHRKADFDVVTKKGLYVVEAAESRDDLKTIDDVN